MAGRGARVERLDKGGAEEVDRVGRCAGTDVDWDAEKDTIRNWGGKRFGGTGWVFT